MNITLHPRDYALEFHVPKTADAAADEVCWLLRTVVLYCA